MMRTIYFTTAILSTTAALWAIVNDRIDWAALLVALAAVSIVAGAVWDLTEPAPQYSTVPVRLRIDSGASWLTVPASFTPGGVAASVHGHELLALDEYPHVTLTVQRANNTPITSPVRHTFPTSLQPSDTVDVTIDLTQLPA